MISLIRDSLPFYTRVHTSSPSYTDEDEKTLLDSETVLLKLFIKDLIISIFSIFGRGRVALCCGLHVIVITFYSPSCLGHETAKGPFGLQVKLPPVRLFTTHGGGFTLFL